ncbi:tryptophan--tRNA ligase [Candidatus Kaiserbacteria bacterium RIFCSPHIGHO2_01_FULL_55_17]|uniref:Tryptophan--tRNA ligase n=1 Tax=Candidatus Kaiserbacteria bacterium RIFCSPHIGHO2_01_FULL_55_17 TaxID=1798484 RepID=A0A1F6D7P3_9BACT|nr:MAG: tryptophan--tRNA ligase [Candidatus Kaiserbacteria bacterium RIFCSPHIGHO2_01_FULL_55_17]
MQRLFTGLQPSGALHIGNYFGVLKQTAEMLKDAEGLVMVADYHALTTLKEPERLRRNITDVVRDYVAVGVDPKRAIIFQQSKVPEHTELAWIFQCLVTTAFLELSHAYKDKVTKGLEANAGLFAYPMLMAADILLYDTDVVPVGEDQRQHVEYAREAAAKFNNAYGETFKQPTEKILKSVAVVPGTDGKKMSKSYGNTIPLFGTKDEIAKAVMSIITDSKAESPEHVYAIHALFRDRASLGGLYSKNKGKYQILKEALVEDIEALIGPMRTRRESISESDVKKILKEGGEKARAHAGVKMKDVRKKIGVTI